MEEGSLNFVIDIKRLQEIMKEEISALRSLFDLMKEEEILINYQKPFCKKTFSTKKNEVCKKLRMIQKRRHEITKKITEDCVEDPIKADFNSNFFNHIIRKDIENSLETFHLRDQVIHFMKIIKTQKELLMTLKKPSQGSMMIEVCEEKKKVQKLSQTQILDQEKPSFEDR